jgi:hypothetical protein
MRPKLTGAAGRRMAEKWRYDLLDEGETDNWVHPGVKEFMDEVAKKEDGTKDTDIEQMFDFIVRSAFHRAKTEELTAEKVRAMPGTHVMVARADLLALVERAAPAAAAEPVDEAPVDEAVDEIPLTTAPIKQSRADHILEEIDELIKGSKDTHSPESYANLKKALYAFNKDIGRDRPTKNLLKEFNES